MAGSRSRDNASPSFVEALERRQLLSHTVFATRLQMYATLDSAPMGTQVEVPISAKLTAAGKPLRTATIDFEDDGTIIDESQTGRSGYASIVLPTFFVGKHSLQTVFAGAERYVKSASGSVAATITVPAGLQSLSDGTEYATVTAGSGTELAEGGAFSANYAGFLESSGELFDASLEHTPAQLETNDSSDDLIPGFAEGIEGMKVGETRIIVIPAADGYGANPPTGSNIPANADLVFMVHLDALS